MINLNIVRWIFPRTSSIHNSSVQYGIRPALVLKDDGEHLLLAAITSKHHHLETHCNIRNVLPHASVVMLEQLFWVRKVPVQVIESIEDERFQDVVKKKLEISLGLRKPHYRGNIRPEIFRGQIYRTDNGENFAILQNNVGNYYSPTTIVGKWSINSISSIHTVDQSMVAQMNLIGRDHNLSKKIRAFI